MIDLATSSLEILAGVILIGLGLLLGLLMLVWSHRHRLGRRLDVLAVLLAVVVLLEARKTPRQ